jgi:hypothetical protein
MRSLTVFCAFVLLTACKQFTLSDNDQLILEQSDRLIMEQKKLVESTTFKRIHAMNDIVLATSSRLTNFEVLELTSNVWKKYQDVSLKIGTTLMADSIRLIDLYDESMTVFGEEMKDKVSLPFENMSYYNAPQLQLELAWNFDQIVGYYSSRIGLGNVYYPLQIALVENNDALRLFLFIKESGDLHERITLPRTLMDSIHIQQLNSWTDVEFTDQEWISLKYFDAMGELKSKEFTEIVTVQKLD